MGDLITALKTIASVKKFVFQGHIADAMADPLLRAAREAIEKSKVAKSPHQEVWSAINHLEAASHYLQSARPHGTLLSMFALQSDQLRWIISLAKQEYVLCLMACCYKALGEDMLMERALNEAETARKGLRISGRSSALEVIDLRLYFQLYRFWRSLPMHIDVEAFRKELVGLSE